MSYTTLSGLGREKERAEKREAVKVCEACTEYAAGGCTIRSDRSVYSTYNLKPCNIRSIRPITNDSKRDCAPAVIASAHPQYSV
jgi:hypothetical protein